MRHLNPVLSAILLSASLAPLCDCAVAAADYRGSVTHGDGRLFTRMKDPLFYPADHPQTRKFCGEQSPGSTCGRLLKSNGGAHVPTIAPVLTSSPPNDLLVTFTHHQSTVIPQSGSDFQPDFFLDHSYRIDSAIADWESPMHLTRLGTKVFSIDSPITHERVVWQAVILDGCSNPPPAVPIDFAHDVEWGPGDGGSHQDVAEFAEVDDTTLDGPGFWNYQFTLAAMTTTGSTALVDVRGTVSVTCTAGIPE